jgi:hypothetical protein
VDNPLCFDYTDVRMSIKEKLQYVPEEVVKKITDGTVSANTLEWLEKSTPDHIQQYYKWRKEKYN